MPFATQVVSALGLALPGTRAGRLLILIYHRVHAQPDTMFPREVTADRFDWQMKLLNTHCAPVSLGDGVDRMRRGTLPARAVVVTFDDGYADNLTVAVPILQKHMVPATFFVSTGFLDGGRMWNDTVVETIRRAHGPDIDLSPLGLSREPLGPEATRGPIAGRALVAIKHLHPVERLERVQCLVESVATDLPGNLMMTSQQVRQVAASGMEVGGHTVNHPILRALSEEEARAEIDGGRQALQRIVGSPVESFAYPNGRYGDDYTLRDRDLVASLGFLRAVATTRGAAHARSDIFQLPRFTPWDRTPQRWLARLLLAFGDAK